VIGNKLGSKRGIMPGGQGTLARNSRGLRFLLNTNRSGKRNEGERPATGKLSFDLQGASRRREMSRSLRAAYDARFSLGHYRGMGRFLRLLIDGREKDFLGLCARGEGAPSLNLIASGSRFYPLWEQFSVPRLLRNQNIEVFLAPYNTAPLRLPRAVRLVLVVHDLIFLDRLSLSRSLYQNAGSLYRRLIVPQAVRRSHVIVTVSRYTSNRLTAVLGVAPSRIRVIPNSLDEAWFLADTAHRTAHRYVLVVAGEAPSKNLPRGLAAFARCVSLLKDDSLELKVAGVKEKFHRLFRAEARRLGVADRVDFLRYLPDEEMRSLYRNATLFLMPSLAEGFGIPVLEAMASGTPVAASASTCLQEVGGNAVRYFDPISIEDMAATMRDILTNPALQAAMSEAGSVQAKKFHPTLVRQQVHSFWAELESARAPGELALR
jgi:glycosyltransferase involved in cell wall biosynthesis